MPIFDFFRRFRISGIYFVTKKFRVHCFLCIILSCESLVFVLILRNFVYTIIGFIHYIIFFLFFIYFLFVCLVIFFKCTSISIQKIEFIVQITTTKQYRFYQGISVESIKLFDKSEYRIWGNIMTP